MNNQIVYANFTQAELDAQYNNRARFPDYETHFSSWTKWSAATRNKLPCNLDVAVGETRFERIDIFPSAATLSPIYVFIKGGYWYSLDKSHYSYVAEGMRPHGITTVTNNFGLAPDHDMDTIVQHNRSTLAWLWRNADEIGADRNRIYIGGHSAGGHLGMILLGTDWPAIDPSLPQNLVKGVCSIGGLHDLEPIRKSLINQKLHLTEDQAQRHSPVNLHFPILAPLLLVTAVDESPELHRQSLIMKEAWERFGYPVEMIVPPGLDHFSVVNNLGNPDSPLVLRQLEQMRYAFSI